MDFCHAIGLLFWPFFHKDFKVESRKKWLLYLALEHLGKSDYINLSSNLAKLAIDIRGYDYNKELLADQDEFTNRFSQHKSDENIFKF